jgi:hypothetical protein
MKAARIKSRVKAIAILYAFFINQYFATTWLKLYSLEQYCIKTRTIETREDFRDSLEVLHRSYQSNVRFFPSEEWRFQGVPRGLERTGL